MRVTHKRETKKKILSIVLGFSMLLILGACGGGKNKSDEWPATGLASLIPKPSSGIISIDHDSNNLFYVTVKKGDDDLYDTYLNECQAMGYTIEAENGSTYDSYKAFNESGYKLRLSSFDPGELSIYLDAPIEIGELRWPKSNLVSLIPQPETEKGTVTRDESDRFYAYVGETDLSSFNAYVDKCYAAGFNVDYTREDEYFSGKNSTGYELTLSYEGFNIMEITLEAPEEETTTTQEETTTEASGGAEGKKEIDISTGLDNITGLASEGEESLKEKLGDIYQMFSGLFGKSGSYEDIYNEYSKKIQDKTPSLIEEYRNEAANHVGDINAQAEIANAKVTVLAEIANEGVEQMAMLYYKDLDYSTYESWATKLYDVYMDYAGQIYDVYLTTAG